MSFRPRQLALALTALLLLGADMLFQIADLVGVTPLEAFGRLDVLGRFLGGICSSGSSDVTSSISHDPAASPGVAASASRISSRLLSEKPPLDSLPPWHPTQCFLRIGTTSWAKSTGRSPPGPPASPRSTR